MKNLKYIAVFLILAETILSSCSGISVTRRRYTKGYFVEHLRHRHAAKPARVNDQPDCNEQPEKVAISTVIRANKTQPAETGTDVSKKNTGLVTAHAATPRIANPEGRSALHPLTLVTMNPVKLLKEVRQPVKSGGLVGAALSLFWIVAVVILILYVVGILLGDFGPIIHLLPVIAVIVLILWLLKIL
jgi:hypothetical protein